MSKQPQNAWRLGGWWSCGWWGAGVGSSLQLPPAEPLLQGVELPFSAADTLLPSGQIWKNQLTCESDGLPCVLITVPYERALAPDKGVGCINCRARVPSWSLSLPGLIITLQLLSPWSISRPFAVHRKGEALKFQAFCYGREGGHSAGRLVFKKERI